jgi:hypothetical protein
MRLRLFDNQGSFHLTFLTLFPLSGTSLATSAGEKGLLF